MRERYAKRDPDSIYFRQLREFKRSLLLAALEEANYCRKATADLLGLHRSGIFGMVRAYAPEVEPLLIDQRTTRPRTWDTEIKVMKREEVKRRAEEARKKAEAELRQMMSESLNGRVKEVA